MNIIIAGAGHVGYELSKTLSPYHNIVVIDKDKLALDSMQESLDILPVFGDVEDPETYKKLLDKEFDLFIAVTDSDEANLISVIIASDTIDAKTTLIRLRNHFFAKSSLMQKFGIDEAIFPIELTSKSVVNLLKYPRANNVKIFKYTDKKLISLRLSKLDGPIGIVPEGYVIVGIERGSEFFIPKQNTQIEPNDLVYLFGDDIDIFKFCKAYGEETSKYSERIVIFGAKELGVSIANALIKEEKEVKLIDKDLEVCNIAEEELGGKATVLNCKFSTKELYEQEGLKHADIVIAATNDDEYNIIKCLEAKEQGVKKVIAINSELEHYELMHSLGIVVIRGPKISAYNAILERIHSSSIVAERNFCGGKGRIYMHKVLENSNVMNKTIKLPKAQENVAIYLIRDGKILECQESLECQAEDVIVAFCSKEQEDSINKWIHSL